MNSPGLPIRMSVPEILGDPCAGTLREHALGLLHAAESSKRLLRAHPGIESDLTDLRDTVERLTTSILVQLADEAGVPEEGESVSRTSNPVGDYRIDRSSGCWIWMRSVNQAGYPVVGRKTTDRENLAARIYWLLAHGALAPDESVVRTCGARLCVSPHHGRATNRREHAAANVRGRSNLSWDAVREIRSLLCESPDGLRDRAAVMAERFNISEHGVLNVFRNKVWFDPEYEPGFELECAGRGCNIRFRTTSSAKKYHDEACQAATAQARSKQTLSRAVPDTRSPERVAQDDAAHRARTAAAEQEWAEAVCDQPRTSVWSVASIDQPIGDGGRLQDVLSSSVLDGDPAQELERTVVRELLGDLTEEAVTAMDDVELTRLRAKLIAEEIVPSAERPSET